MSRGRARGLASRLVLKGLALEAAAGVRRRSSLAAGVTGSLVAVGRTWFIDYTIRYVAVAARFAALFGAVASYGERRRDSRDPEPEPGPAGDPSPLMTLPIRGRIVVARPGGGGPGAVAERAAEELRRRGWSVSEVVLDKGANPVLAAVFAAIANWRALRRADLVHVELGALDLAAFWFGLLVGRVRTTVVVAHDAPGVTLTPGAGLIRGGTRWRDVVGHRLLSPLLDRALLRCLARSARVGVVFTETARNDWQSSGPRRIVVIDHGADPPARGRPLPSAGLHVLCAGFIGPTKGIDVLLDAWTRVSGTSPLPLVIAGTHTGGRQGERYEQHVRELGSRTSRVPTWHGWVSEPELERLIATSAVVVVPYRRSNPASGIIVRAMVEGRPLIATRVPAALDTLQDEVDGLLVAPDDAEALAAALNRLLHDPALRDQLGDAAARRAAGRFTWSRHIEGLEAAYALARGHT